MAASTSSRLTRRRGDGTVHDIPVAANVTIFQGCIVGANSSGHAGPLNSTFSRLAGVAQADVTNGATAAAVSISVRRGCAFAFVNDTTAAVAQSHVMTKGALIDDQTVSNGTGTPAYNPGSVAEMRIESIDPATAEVWVYLN